ncbi:DUF4124 domain-containing protein [Caenimonas koreensis DSM 17982]|uniref:DUF4124 domain-containing protein n=1 Tax=Caenimonas koreensis DSM 17982 TaxID=1121255 RepID=A0A844AYG3_9BURK|nr:DUF4124 domain-containing protein [Caenimonas koreensis]MRD45813.1 DUF4124 domain-containing protein [Caenimonas koreensis DSM 17982]
MSTARQLLATGLMGLLGVTAFIGGDASAQQIYRIIGPDGKVTFSDQPPAAVVPGKSASSTSVRSSAGSDGPALAVELRNAMSRFPVTMYTGANCDPCSRGRTSLSARGIPFSEKTVTTVEDLDALKRLQGGSAALPLLTIGGQQLKGFNESEWNDFLDAAGYPKTSMLPPNYRQAPAGPVVAVQAPATPASAPAAQAAAPGAAPRAPAAAENPAGIRF